MTDPNTIEISCEEVWQEVSNYIDGEVSAELRERMRLHFRDCAHCSAILDGANNVVKLVGDVMVLVPTTAQAATTKSFALVVYIPPEMAGVADVPKAVRTTSRIAGVARPDTSTAVKAMNCA